MAESDAIGQNSISILSDLRQSVELLWILENSLEDSFSDILLIRICAFPCI